MKLIPQPDDLKEMYIHKLASETGLVNMAIYPVAFGFRVRGWLSTESFCHLDWCAGADLWAIERLYAMLYNILEHRDETPDVFNDLPPYSQIKPYFNDPDFVVDLAVKLTTPVNTFDLKDIFNKKTKLYNAYLACTPLLS